MTTSSLLFSEGGVQVRSPAVGLHVKESGFDIFRNYEQQFDFFLFGKNLTPSHEALPWGGAGP